MIQTQLFENFVEFARGRLSEAESLSQLLDAWEIQREEEETIQSIRRGLEEMEAGKGIPLEEAMAELRNKLGLMQ